MQHVQMPDPTHTELLHLALFGSVMPVELKILPSYATVIDFDLYGASYTFQVTRWSGQGFANFQKRFHAHCDRDATRFGPFRLGAEGQVLSSKSLTQKMEVVFQGCSDVIACVQKICNK